MKIGIIGNGVVGGATAAAFHDHVDEVRCWDARDERCTHSLHDTVCGTDLTFVCLPTPKRKDGIGCDTSIIKLFFERMGELKRDANLVLRSTVPVGFTRYMREEYGIANLVHSPEFLTARTAVEDSCNPTRLLIGVPQPTENRSRCRETLEMLYMDRWYHNRGLLYEMTSDESEFVKLMQNAFSAVKVGFFNEMREFSDKKGLDWERCLAALLAGRWINPMHTQVPGPDGKRGWGGACLPKDISNLIQCGLTANVSLLICGAAALRNDLVDRKE